MLRRAAITLPGRIGVAGDGGDRVTLALRQGGDPLLFRILALGRLLPSKLHEDAAGGGAIHPQFAVVHLLDRLQRLLPGMQTTVMVKTGERTLMTYLMNPLQRRFQSGLRER